MQGLSWWAALGAGAASFFTPCHLALLPAYVAFLAGDGQRRGLFFLGNALAFCLGFATAFLALGASFGYLGMLLSHYHGLFRWGSGLIMMIFGLHMSGLLQISLLNRERRWHTLPRNRSTGAFLLGFSFAFAWTPCVGPVLGSILALAGLAKSALAGIWLLTAYSIGMSIPFLFVAWMVYNGNVVLVKKYYSLAGKLNKAGGLLLILLGMLTLLGKFSIGR
jgi:cytochrome c biogenesis protein CcdA